MENAKISRQKTLTETEVNAENGFVFGIALTPELLLIL
jgi:hypothetical protein